MLDTVARFLLAYAPGQTEDHLFRGNQNRMALPDVQDFTIFDIAGTQRIGTNVGSYAQAANSIYETLVLREYTVQIDFFAEDHKTAAARATAIESLGRSYVGVKFFEQYGITLTYCDDAQYIPYTDLSEQYVYRYRITMHLTKWENYETSEDYFDEIVIKKFEIVNGHTPHSNE